MICHKDYNGPDSQMRVFDDRITFWNQGSLPSGITPESIFKPHDSHPRNRLIANVFYMAGFVEAWGRGYELITEAFTKEGLEVPIIEEEFGGVRVIIKREVFYAIQHGGRIDPKTGRLITSGDKVDDKENDKVKLSQLTDRQQRIVSIIKLDDKVTAEGIKQYFTESLSIINREITALKKAGILAREGGDRNGRWVILI